MGRVLHVLCINTLFTVLLLVGTGAYGKDTLPQSKGKGFYVELLHNPVNRIIDDTKFSQGIPRALEVLDSIYTPEILANPQERIKYLHIKASIYLESQQFIEALNALNEEISLLKSGVDPILLADVTFIKGDVYWAMGNYTSAFRQYYEANRISDQLVDEPCIRAGYDYRLGMVFYKQKQFKDAKKSFIEAYDNYVYCETNQQITYKRQEILDNIGLCLLQENNSYQALLFFDSALAVVRNITIETERDEALIETAEAVIYGNKAKAFLQLGDTHSAETLYLKSIHINLGPRHDIADAGGAILQLIELKKQQRDYKAVSKWLNTLDSVFQKRNIKELEGPILELKWKYYRDHGDKDSALKYALKALQFEDSLVTAERQMKKANVEAAFRAMEKEFELEKLREEYERNKLVNALVTTLLTVAVIGIAVVLTSVIFLRRKNRRLTELNQQINEQKKELEQAYEQLKQLNLEKDRIMGIVAHDLRNPIASIQAIVSLLINNQGMSLDEHKELLQLVHTACLGAHDLIQEILLTSEMSAQNEKRNWDTFQVNPLLSEVVNIFRFRATEKEQLIQLSLPSNDMRLKGDVEKLRRAFVNVLANAMKFSPRGSTIQVKAYAEGRQIVILFVDQGIGIPKALQEHIFDPFSTARRSGTEGEQPAGLGLFIVKQIIEAHQGSITVESKENEGTTFVIRLPLLPLQDDGLMLNT